MVVEETSPRRIWFTFEVPCMQLPPPDLIGLMAVLVLAGIVVWDAVWLVRQSRLVPELGPAPGGYAWASGGAEEAIRHWGNLFSMAAMLVLPWGFIRMSDTSAMWAVLWDVLLLLHLVGLLVPKRYAVTRTHLIADGQRYAWERLKLAERQPRRRIMLLRRGWGIFGPLPVAAEANELTTVRAWIAAGLLGGEAWSLMLEEE